MFKSEKCTRGGNTHKFSPRFSETERENTGGNIRYFGLDELRNYLTLQVYICDVCEWCGKRSK
jgi:hypothetical protein